MVEMPRGFGFIRFPTVEESKAFMERNYPFIHLYGSSKSGDEQTAKVRIAFSRERDDRNRSERSEGEWTCKIVSTDQSLSSLPSFLTIKSVRLSTSQAGPSVTAVKRHRSV